MGRRGGLGGATSRKCEGFGLKPIAGLDECGAAARWSADMIGILCDSVMIASSDVYASAAWWSTEMKSIAVDIVVISQLLLLIGICSEICILIFIILGQEKASHE